MPVRKASLPLLFVLLFSLPLRAALADEWIYTVRPGDNLWDLTERYLVSLRYWQPLKELNRIERPRRLRPGSKIRIPLAWSKVRYVDAEVVEVHGEVTVNRAGGRSQPVTAGMRLKRHDRLQTGPDGNLLLEFSDGTRLLLTAQSSATLQRLEGYGNGEVGDARVEMNSGRVETRANPHKIRGTRFEISTPSALTAVRGTGFRVALDEQGRRSRIEVLEGEVRVSNAGKSQRLKGGFGVISEQGAAPAKPVELLPEPPLNGVPTLVEDVSFQFRLQPVAGARAYRVQVAERGTLTALVFDRAFPDGRVRIDVPDLADGFYVMKVRAVDAHGLEGRDAVRRFELNARPAAPFQITPAAETAFVDPRPVFEWAESKEAASYHFQLAGNESFDRPQIDLASLRETRFQPEWPLESGRYFWRVTAIDAAGKPGPQGAVQSFRILPKAPKTEPPALDQQGIDIHWRAGRPGQSYRLQMAADEQFTRVIEQVDTAETRVRLPKPQPGDYYLRVKAIDADGAEGPYGRSQHIRVRGEDRSWIVMIPVALMVLLAL